MTEDEMVGWHHRLRGHEFEEVPGAGDEQGGLACCSPCGCKQSETTERLNNNIVISGIIRISETSGRARSISTVNYG